MRVTLETIVRFKFDMTGEEHEMTFRQLIQTYDELPRRNNWSSPFEGGDLTFIEGLETAVVNHNIRVRFTDDMELWRLPKAGILFPSEMYFDEEY
jgi:hypothetical protein